MDTSKRGIDLIRGSEGAYTLLPDGRYKSYLDKLAKPPVWTVYYGLTKGVTAGTCITVEEGERMFAKELAVYEDAIERYVKVPLNQNQFDALVSFTYNCGPGALKKSTLLKLLNQGKYEQVPAQLMHWTHAGGKEWPGLVTRRKAEGAVFMTPVAAEAIEHLPPETVPEQPPMPQQAQSTAPAVTTTLATSKTVRYSGGGIIAALVSAWQWLFGVAKDAGTQAVSDQQSLSPFQALFKAIGANMELIAIIVVLGCLVAVILERIAKERA